MSDSKFRRFAIFLLICRILLFFLIAEKKPGLKSNGKAFSMGFHQSHTNFENIFEAHFHIKNGKSPFSGNIFHGSPFYLILVQILNKAGFSYFYTKFAFSCIVSICDFISAFCLKKAVDLLCPSPDKSENSDGKPPSIFSCLRSSSPYFSSIVCLLFLTNPFSIYCSNFSFSTVHYSLTLVALLQSVEGNLMVGCLFLVLGSLVEVYSAMFLPVLVLVDGVGVEQTVSLKRLLFSFVKVVGLVSVIGAMYFAAFYHYFGSFDFVEKSYLYTLSSNHMNPHFGLFWYLFSQMFLRFRTIFLFIFNTHFIAISIPLTISLWKFPIFLFLYLLLIQIVFKPYPIFADLYIFFLVLFSIQQYLHHTRHFLPLVITVLFSLAAQYLLWFLWVLFESMNINFIFTLSLVCNVPLVFLLVDVLYSFIDFNQHQQAADGKNKTD